jgi:hypothetical protein
VRVAPVAYGARFAFGFFRFYAPRLTGNSSIGSVTISKNRLTPRQLILYNQINEPRNSNNQHTDYTGPYFGFHGRSWSRNCAFYCHAPGARFKTTEYSHGNCSNNSSNHYFRNDNRSNKALK